MQPLLLSALLLLIAPFAASAAEARVEKDIPYLGSERQEKLDAYLPSSDYAGPHPAILLIHGGGWIGSDKAARRQSSIASTLAAQGYAVFSINYLLNFAEKTPGATERRLSRLAWPQNLYDCKTALRWIRFQAVHYNVNPANIAVMGGSAGGHLSMLVGATANDAEINRHGLYTDQSNAVSCVLNFYGDFDIRGRDVSPIAGVTGATAGQIAALETAASPITYLDAKTPPMFITHGTADKVIPVERSRLLAQYLRGLGVDYWYVEIGGATHSYGLQPKQMDLRPVVLSFLEKYLGKPSLRESRVTPRP